MSGYVLLLQVFAGSPGSATVRGAGFEVLKACAVSAAVLLWPWPKRAESAQSHSVTQYRRDSTGLAADVSGVMDSRGFKQRKDPQRDKIISW